MNVKINKNDLQIKTIGKLLDLANEEQIKTFYNSNNIVYTIYKCSNNQQLLIILIPE